MVANILPIDTPSTQGVGSKCHTIYFCESSHVAYQIKGNLAQSTMKANMLSLHTLTRPGRVEQSVTCLATDACMTADPGVASSIPVWSHTFVEIDHEMISTVILLPSADSFKKGCCQLQAKVCARITG